MDKLIFKGKEYELIEIPFHKFVIYGKEYEDIGFNSLHGINEDIPRYSCFSLRIKDNYYGLKLLKSSDG